MKRRFRIIPPIGLQTLGFFSTLALAALVGRGASQESGKAEPRKGPRLDLTAAQWHEDLAYFARELPKRHAKAFHFTPREQFEAGVADLDKGLDRLNSDEIVVGLERLANLIGDGHTNVAFPADKANLPLDFARFGDGYRVTSVAPGYEKALGARVIKVENMPITKVRELLLPLTAQNETPWLAEGRIEAFLTTGLVLRGMGIAPDRSIVHYTFCEDGGHEFICEVHALPPDARPKWLTAYKEPPLFRQKPELSFWYQVLPDSKTMYCCFRGYTGLGKQAAALLKRVFEKRPEKLVIDMRQNGGGDYTEGLRHLVRPIKSMPDLNKKGHLFILIGPNTFSAAMSNSAHFRYQTAALLVGQPIGEKPNSYQESRRMTLPNSRLVVRYSVRFYKFVETGENLIRPDQEIVPTWDDFKAGRDPVLDWVLKYQTHP
jgi:hypothetical protein